MRQPLSAVVVMAFFTAIGSVILASILGPKWWVVVLGNVLGASVGWGIVQALGARPGFKLLFAGTFGFMMRMFVLAIFITFGFWFSVLVIKWGLGLIFEPGEFGGAAAIVLVVLTVFWIFWDWLLGQFLGVE